MWLFALYLLILVAVLSMAIAARSMAPWVPTWQADINRALDLAELKSGEVFYDFGCGNGKVVFAAARRGARAKGIELGLPLYVWCIVRKLVTRSSAKFKWGNAFRHSLADADVVYVFGMPKQLQTKLASKLKQELKPGARVISYAFPIEGLEIVTKSKPAPKQMAIYKYQL